MGVLLLATLATGLYVHRVDSETISELKAQISTLEEQEKLSAVDRRVSKQMEEIAYGQQILSEERSREAIRQSEIAQKMTLRSEVERKKALDAQALAEFSAQEAMESYQMAERQRKEAEIMRRQAEYAKQVADTLNYISLGRTLGGLSYSIYQTGDTELGNMLAYASYLYTNDYDGDLYSTSIFPALTQSAGGRQNWGVHNGSIATIDFFPNEDRLISVSTYGEFFLHEFKDGQLISRHLMKDNTYCFRDAYASETGKCYAVSHTGHLVTASPNSVEVINLENLVRPFGLEPMNDATQLLIIGENGYALLDIATDKIVGRKLVDFKINSESRRDNCPILFDDKGRMHLVKSLDDITDERVPVPGVVTSYASSKNEHLSAYGMSDGTIWLIDKNGGQRKLMGHLSEVTRLKLNGKRLYSSAYDGKLLFWKTDENLINPITLYQANSWLTYFTFDPKKNFIWTGESNGTVTEHLMSLSLIGQRLKNNVNRNFTQAEWDYYVGKGIPYREMSNEQ